MSIKSKDKTDVLWPPFVKASMLQEPYHPAYTPGLTLDLWENNIHSRVQYLEYWCESKLEPGCVVNNHQQINIQPNVKYIGWVVCMYQMTGDNNTWNIVAIVPRCHEPECMYVSLTHRYQSLRVSSLRKIFEPVGFCSIRQPPQYH